MEYMLQLCASARASCNPGCQVLIVGGDNVLFAFFKEDLRYNHLTPTGEVLLVIKER